MVSNNSATCNQKLLILILVLDQFGRLFALTTFALSVPITEKHICEKSSRNRSAAVMYGLIQVIKQLLKEYEITLYRSIKDGEYFWSKECNKSSTTGRHIK